MISVLVVIYFWMFAFMIWYFKKQHMYCFLPFGFINLLFLSLIHLAIIQHSLEQIWSTPICYVLTRAADLNWDTFILNQEWNCEPPCWRFWWITKSSVLRDVSAFFKEVWALSFCVSHHFHHYIQYDLLLENYCKNLLVY